MTYRDPLPIPLSDRFRIERRPASPRPAVRTPGLAFWRSFLVIVLAIATGTAAGLLKAGHFPWRMP